MRLSLCCGLQPWKSWNFTVILTVRSPKGDRKEDRWFFGVSVPVFTEVEH